MPEARRYRRYSCRVNADGLRGWRRHSKQRPDDTFRIGVLGTGVTFGEGVSMRHTFTRRLERALEQDPPLDADFEVINFGTPCLTANYAQGNFVHYREQWQVDLWIVALGVNDALPMFNRSVDDFRVDVRALVEELERSGDPTVVLVEPINSFYPWLHRYPPYLEALRSEVEPHLPLLDVAAILDCLEARDGLRLEVDADLQQVVRYSEGEPELLFEARYLAGSGRPYIAPEIYEYIDTHEVFLRTFITDVHLNRFGHQRVADALHSYLWAHLRGEPHPQLDVRTCTVQAHEKELPE
jgi:lysophospholipase L1-like esterase